MRRRFSRVRRCRESSGDRTPSARNRSLLKVGAAEIGSAQVGITDYRIAKVCSAEVRLADVGAAQNSAAKVGAVEFGLAKIRADRWVRLAPGIPGLGSLSEQ
jgi:hypothetical protein